MEECWDKWREKKRFIIAVGLFPRTRQHQTARYIHLIGKFTIIFPTKNHLFFLNNFFLYFFHRKTININFLLLLGLIWLGSKTEDSALTNQPKWFISWIKFPVQGKTKFLYVKKNGVSLSKQQKFPNLFSVFCFVWMFSSGHYFKPRKIFVGFYCQFGLFICHCMCVSMGETSVFFFFKS